MDFVIDFEGRVGLREKGKWWKVIDGHRCFLADPEINRLFDVVRDWVKHSPLSRWDRKTNSGLLRYAVIRATTLRETMVTIVTSVPADEQETNTVQVELENLAMTLQATTLVWSVNSTVSDVSFGDTIHVIAGPCTIKEEIATRRYIISPNAFFQTNSHAAPILLKTVEEFADDLSKKTVLDLYCGTGFFAIALAARAKRTIGIEMMSEAIADARINATKNAVNIECIDAKTEDSPWWTHKADVVILDPPRSGMHDNAFRDLLANPPETIVYVSCNPKNFAREMVQLARLYRVDEMRAIDMFPHTPHVELVTRLVRR